MKKKYLVLYLVILLPIISLAQVKIKGKILNSDDQSPVPFATIQTDAQHKTISNETGDFELTVDKLPVLLKVSHTSFQGIKLNKNDDTQVTIALKPVVLTLNEVVVGNYALTLMKNALAKAKKNISRTKLCQSFFKTNCFRKW